LRPQPARQPDSRRYLELHDADHLTEGLMRVI
jgi:hypothetical protein